jgi:hypothetical protein
MDDPFLQSGRDGMTPDIVTMLAWDILKGDETRTIYRYHTLLKYDSANERIYYRYVDDRRRLMENPVVLVDDVRRKLRDLLLWVHSTLWSKRITHGDITDSNILDDPATDSFVLIDWEHMASHENDHELRYAVAVDILNLVCAVEYHYPIYDNHTILRDVYDNEDVQSVLRVASPNMHNTLNTLSDDTILRASRFAWSAAMGERRRVGGRRRASSRRAKGRRKKRTMRR